MTRKDLSPGYQSVQPAHAGFKFAIEYENIFKNWQVNHKNLIVLSVKDEKELRTLLLKARSKGIAVSSFLEPDIDNQLTAIAMEPSMDTYALTGSLDLALKKAS